MTVLDDLRSAFLTSALTDDQREQLIAVGEEKAFADGEVLFGEGEPAELLWILLEGTIELTRVTGGEATVVTTMSTPGQWAGGLQAWGADAGYRATGHAVGNGRCLVLPSSELKRLVGEWFPFGGHLIVGIFQTVRSIEATVRQREALVALGTMAAGLAHELNNPAAASLRAVSALGDTCDSLLSSLTEMAAASMTAEQFAAVDELRREAMDATAPQGAMVLSDREDAIGTWLSARGVDGAWHVAPILARAGVDVEWCTRVLDAVTPPVASSALTWISSAVSATDLLDEVRDTTTRIANLVDAVKSYSQMDRSALQSVQVCDGIEATLAMLGHKLHEVEIVRDFAPDLPTIEVYAGELNQVWTNLIDNAVDAMEGVGTLRISARVDGADLSVDITDTGHGMTEAVRARAFEPFFTTKDVGRGTGLGLDISRRIVVERHGGRIDFESSDAGTTAHVRIPIKR